MITIRSGGQTGVDRAALDAAMAAGVPVAGWCPAGRRAEDGTIPERYPLVETASADYAERTRLNVLEADATLILAPEPLLGGTALTAEAARDCGRPFRIADPARADPADLAAWIRAYGARDVNVAGPRESEVPGIYALARDFVMLLLAEIENHG